MRFPRHARIFRGPVDAAPMAGVFLLLMIFIMLGSLVYTPGVMVDAGPAITVTSSNLIAFAGKTYKPGEMDQLRIDLRAWPGNRDFAVKVQPGANPSLGQQVSNLFQITLPSGKDLAGTDNETAVVRVNFLGQCFFENRLVQDAELKHELARRLRLAERDSKQLTLVLMMDQAAELKVLTRLEGLAREVGIPDIERAVTMQ
ncbi:MAG TPA: hypothetical protein VGO59_11895 [Verrucomicrobiae bacterium]|jgi:biopolymer transport protein ExbD